MTTLKEIDDRINRLEKQREGSIVLKKYYDREISFLKEWRADKQETIEKINNTKKELCLMPQWNNGEPCNNCLICNILNMLLKQLSGTDSEDKA